MFGVLNIPTQSLSTNHRRPTGRDPAMSIETPSARVPSCDFLKKKKQTEAPRVAALPKTGASGDEGCCQLVCEAFGGHYLHEDLQAHHEAGHGSHPNTLAILQKMKEKNGTLCKVRCLLLLLFLAATGATTYYVTLAENPQLIHCSASGDSCDTPLRCCIEPNEACVQHIHSDFTSEPPSCRPYDPVSGCGPNCVLVPLPGQDQSCNFHSQKVPCEYLDTNWRTENEPYSKVLEIDISSHTQFEPPNPGSTHELGRAPDGTVWFSNQESDLIVTMTLDVEAVPFEDAFSMQAHPIKKPDGSAANGFYGLHAMVWPKFYAGSDPIMYLVLEYNNSVGIYNWKTHTLLRTVEIPLSCAHAGQAFQGGTCVGRSWGTSAFECQSCMDAPGAHPTHSTFSRGCPTGTRPHALAEDSDGNVWVALKAGASVTRDSNAHRARKY